MNALPSWRPAPRGNERRPRKRRAHKAMRVFSLLQRDTTKCRSALDSLKALLHELLDEAMEGGIEVHVMSSTPERQPANYHGEKGHTDENARQLGKAAKNSIDMERMYAEMETVHVAEIRRGCEQRCSGSRRTRGRTDRGSSGSPGWRGRSGGRVRERGPLGQGRGGAGDAFFRLCAHRPRRVTPPGRTGDHFFRSAEGRA